MAEKKLENKNALLLLPIQLTQNKNILRSLHVTKNTQGLKYDIANLDDNELRRYYHELPNQAKQGLYQLTSEGLYKMESEIIKRHKLTKSGAPLRDFLLPAIQENYRNNLNFLNPLHSW